MKIAIATDDFSTVTGHIGRCKGFIIYEIENDKIINKVEKENIFTNHIHHGHNHSNSNEKHGHSHTRLIEALKDCSHLICTTAGWRVVEDLKQNNIEVIFTEESDAESAALKFSKGELLISDNGFCHTH